MIRWIAIISDAPHFQTDAKRINISIRKQETCPSDQKELPVGICGHFFYLFDKWAFLLDIFPWAFLLWAFLPLEFFYRGHFYLHLFQSICVQY
jgi:hypothetical protein